MSRGRGRGGRGRPGTARIGGIDVNYDEALELADRPQPTPLFPDYEPTRMKPLSAIERKQVANFRLLRENIHEGPLYTVLHSSSGFSNPSSRTAAGRWQTDPFEGMETYSQRYSKKRRTIPKLDTRPYVLEFFPKELWSTLDPSTTTSKGLTGTKKRKRIAVDEPQRSSDPIGDDNEGEDRRGPVDPANEEDEADVDPDEDEGEDQVDDEYDDEESMAGDYNAEQYFDDGGDDAGEDYNAGDDEGEY